MEVSSRQAVLLFAFTIAALWGCHGQFQTPIAESWQKITANGDSGSNGSGPAETPYEKYGGATSVSQIVDETWSLMLSDPETSKTFSSIGKNRGESVDQVKSCLDLQMSVLLEGPGDLPGVSYTRRAPSQGYDCQDISRTFFRLGISSEVFDKFMIHLIDVLKAHGFEEDEINEVTKDLLSEGPSVVSSL